jgi:ankyrin repeat protein
MVFAKDSGVYTPWLRESWQGNVQILQKVREGAKEDLREKDLIINVLLAQDGNGHTALHLAVENGDINVVEKLWEWATEKLTREELRNKLLLAKDISSAQTALHSAASRGNKQILEK